MFFWYLLISCLNEETHFDFKSDTENITWYKDVQLKLRSLGAWLKGIDRLTNFLFCDSKLCEP